MAEKPKTIEELRETLLANQRPEPTALTAGTAEAMPVLPVQPVQPSNPAAARQKFDASDIADLEYSLKPHVDAEGTVPFPSRQRYNKFARRMTKILTDNAELVQLLSNAEDRVLRENPQLIDQLMAQTEKNEQEQRDAVADLCNGHPTKAQLNKLPDVVFNRFYAWLRGQLNPEV